MQIKPFKKRLETERLTLRKATENDIEDLFEIYCDEEVMKFVPIFPIKTIDEAKKIYIKEYEECYTGKVAFPYVIEDTKSKKVIGYVAIHNIGEANDLGYGLRKDFWHKGIVTEAASAVVAEAKRCGLKFLTATHDVYNPRSGEVMKKVGMTYRYSYEEIVQPKNYLVTFRMYQINLDYNEDRVYNEYRDKYRVHFIEEVK